MSSTSLLTPCISISFSFLGAVISISLSSPYSLSSLFLIISSRRELSAKGSPKSFYDDTVNCPSAFLHLFAHPLFPSPFLTPSFSFTCSSSSFHYSPFSSSLSPISGRIARSKPSRSKNSRTSGTRCWHFLLFLIFVFSSPLRSTLPSCSLSFSFTSFPHSHSHQLDHQRLITSARFVHKELPIRLAKELRNLEVFSSPLLLILLLLFPSSSLYHLSSPHLTVPISCSPGSLPSHFFYDPFSHSFTPPTPPSHPPRLTCFLTSSSSLRSSHTSS